MALVVVALGEHLEAVLHMHVFFQSRLGRLRFELRERELAACELIGYFHTDKILKAGE